MGLTRITGQKTTFTYTLLITQDHYYDRKKKDKTDELKPYTEYLEIISQSHDRSSVFHDYLTMVVCSLLMQQKEDVYLATVKKYTREELTFFTKAFASMILWMEAHPLYDPFADYFQHYISHGHNGQYFTPDSVADMMARIADPQGEGLRVNDCCCGSGGLLLAAARVNREQEFFGADISEVCCLMTLINLCLNDLTGEVYHMNALSMEIWRAWRICRWPITRHPYIRELTIADDPDSSGK